MRALTPWTGLSTMPTATSAKGNIIRSRPSRRGQRRFPGWRGRPPRWAQARRRYVRPDSQYEQMNGTRHLPADRAPGWPTP
jgi:hypothetical protein